MRPRPLAMRGLWRSCGSSAAVGGRHAAEMPSAEKQGAPPPGFRDLWDVVSGPQSVIDSLLDLVPPTAVLADERGRVADLARAGRRTDGASSPAAVRWSRGLHAARRTEAGAEAHLRARNELESVNAEHARLTALQEDAAAVAERALLGLREAEAAYMEAEESLRLAERAVLGSRNEADLLARRLDEARLQLEELKGREEKERSLGERLRLEEERVGAAIGRRELELEAARGNLRSLQSGLDATRQRVARLEEKKAQAALLEVRLRERCRAQEAERERTRSQRDAAAADAERYGRRVEMLAAYVPVLGGLLGCCGTAGGADSRGGQRPRGVE